MSTMTETAWKHPSLYDEMTHDIVQVLCEVLEPKLSDFPRACEMPISSGDHGVGELFISIGWCDDEGEWHVAGWDMMQDCWDDARCYVVHGWQPLAGIAPPPQDDDTSAQFTLEELK